MKPAHLVEIEIDGVGRLSNHCLADAEEFQLLRIDMKIAIIGAGAIGGLVGAKLALAGEDVTFIVRGANLEAIGRQRHQAGVGRGRGAGGAQRTRPPTAMTRPVREDIVVPRDEGPPGRGRGRTTWPKLFGPDRRSSTMRNGIPYWYFHQHGGVLAGTTVRSVDPGGCAGHQDPAAARDRLRGPIRPPS